MESGELQDSVLISFLERWRLSQAHRGVITDFDGTLAKIVPDPDAVSVEDGVPNLLTGLARDHKLVAILSGRRASQLDRLIGAAGVAYIGLYGAESIIDEKLIQPKEADHWRGMASRLARDAEAFASAEGLEGVNVEFKDLAVSVHYRSATRAGAETLLLDWAATAAPRRGFVSGQGRKVIELRPRGISKAGAAQRLIEESKLTTVVIAGDDSADVEAMETVKALLGEESFAVGVASAEEPAGLRDISDVVVGGPPGVIEILKLLKVP